MSFIALSARAQSDGYLHIHFLNVGQGDGIFIETKEGNQILIDGGPGKKVIQELGRVMPFDDRSIDMLLLSHPHADHVSGLIEVLNRFEVDRIIESTIPYDSAEYSEWDSVKLEVPVTQAIAGQVINIGEDATLTILYPFESGAMRTKVGSAHEYMVVARLDYGDSSVIFTGDAENDIERKLVLAGMNLDVDFLKVGHHGSRTSTSAMFLDAVTPEAAFIQTGEDNRYGHPHSETIQRLEDYGIKYYRTDKDGPVELILDGQNYIIKTL
ncbi:MAG: ComEC/Rec2 family competence protein [Candidatus Paceibacterota bacterium]